MKTRILLILLTTVCMAITSGCSKDEEKEKGLRYERKSAGEGTEPRYELRQSYKPGKYMMTSRTSSEQEVYINGQRVTPGPTQTRTMTMTLDVSEPDSNGRKTIVSTVNRIQINSNEMSVDTDEPRETYISEPAMKMHDMVMALKKMRLVMTQAADGKFIAVEGMETLWDELAASNPEIGPMFDQMKQSFNDEQFTGLLCLQEGFFPDHPVGKGAVWHSSVSFPLPMVGKFSFNAQFELIDVEDTSAGKIASILLNAETDMSSDKETNIGPASMKITKGDMYQTSLMKINLDTGMLISQDMSLDSDMEMSIHQGDRTAKTASKVKLKTVVEVEKVL